MPDSRGKLIQSEKIAIREWLAKYSPPGGMLCQVCKNDSWGLAQELINLPVLIPGVPVPFSYPTYPQIMIICDKCGHSVFFNAVVAGLVPSDKITAADVKPSDGEEVVLDG